MNVFGYAAGLRADTPRRPRPGRRRRWRLPRAGSRPWRVAQKRRATIMHAHWVIPGGMIAAMAAGARPLVVSLHGSDVFVAERHAAIGRAARAVFARALGHRVQRRPASARAGAWRRPGLHGDGPVRRGRRPVRAESRRARIGAARDSVLGDAPLVFSAGRLVQQERIRGAGRCRAAPPANVAGRAPAHCRRRRPSRRADGSGGRAHPAGAHRQSVAGRHRRSRWRRPTSSRCRRCTTRPGTWMGCPNFALEALANGHTGHCQSRRRPATDDRARVNGLLVPERDVDALTDGLHALLADPAWASRSASERGRRCPAISAGRAWPSGWNRSTIACADDHATTRSCIVEAVSHACRSQRGKVLLGRAMSDYREFYRGRRVLITGGLGFIGSNLARPWSISAPTCSSWTR